MRRKGFPHQDRLYGLVAEFDDAESLREAAHRMQEAGYRRTDAYTPYPVEGLAESLGMRRTYISLIVLLGGIAGGVGAFLLQAYLEGINYPLNVGGKPLFSWPAFVPVTFELTILVAAISAVLGMFLLNGLPQPYHPLFNLEQFARSTRDGFFLSIEARDPKFDPERTRAFLSSLSPREVYDVTE
jgi:hypothetical protein